MKTEIFLVACQRKKLYPQARRPEENNFRRSQKGFLNKGNRKFNDKILSFPYKVLNNLD